MHLFADMKFETISYQSFKVYQKNKMK